MSGRLVILPHKSWNVWNRDNREKVQRDERLHREAGEAQAEREKEITQERNVALLRAEQREEDVERGYSNTVETFRLFEEAEQLQGAKLGNPDYLREKALKEQNLKKREGVPDLPLGGDDRGGVKPWYEKVRVRDGEVRKLYGSSYSSYSSSSSSHAESSRGLGVERDGRDRDGRGGRDERESEGRERQGREGRDEREGREGREGRESRDDRERRRKGLADPMRVHLNPNEKGGILAPRRGSKKPILCNDPPTAHTAHTSAIAPRTSRWDAGSSGTVDSGDGGGGGGNGGDAGDAWAALRQKRLLREEGESKRAKRLLASQDMASPMSSVYNGEGDGYGQQYHPHLAKKNRY
jgi:hypothetical protein